jgi:hypothetical protein
MTAWLVGDIGVALYVPARSIELAPQAIAVNVIDPQEPPRDLTDPNPNQLQKLVED